MLVGSILTYSQLSRRSEIPAIRAAGVSAWRFLGPVMVLALRIGVLMVTVLDPLATRLNAGLPRANAQRLLGHARTAPNGLEASGSAKATCRPTAAKDRWAPVADDNPTDSIIQGRSASWARGEALEDVTFWYFRPEPG